MNRASATDKFPVALTLDDLLEHSPVGFFQYRLLLLCGFMFMADSLEVNLLVFISTCASIEWNLSHAQQASITSVVFVGMVIGSLFWGIIADRYGRKTTFLMAASLISAGGFLSGIAPSFGWLLFFRTVCGFGIGGANIPIDMLAEFLPSTHRGHFVVYIEYFWTLGTLFVTGLAWSCLSSQGWRVLAFITAIPVTLTCLLSIWLLPESPRWLLMKGRNTEAEKIIKDVAVVNNITLAPFTLINNERVHDKDAKYRDLLMIPEVRRVTLPLWVVWGAFGFTYYGLILFVGRIYSKEEIGNDQDAKTCSFDYSAVFINASAEIAGVLIAAFFLDKLGRIRTQTVFYLLAGLAAVCMGIKMPVGAALAVSLVGRMAVFAASVSYLSLCRVVGLLVGFRMLLGYQRRSCTLQRRERWAMPPVCPGQSLGPSFRPM